MRDSSSIIHEIELQWETVVDMMNTLNDMSPTVAFGATCTLVDFMCERLGLSLDEYYALQKHIKESENGGNFFER